MKENKSHLISVIIPLKKLTYYLLFENIPEFEKQTYKNFEVIILPNEHAQYDLTLLKKYKWLKIIPTGKVIKPAEKRNLGVKTARGDIIAFIDDDAYPRPDWLEQAVKKFDKSISAVCGPGLLPKNAGNWEKIFDQVITSNLGSGQYTYRFIPQKQRYVDDYPSMNFFVKKNIFQKIGGFKGNYWPGEDSKLCEDIVYKENGTILYHPKVVVYHHRRNNLAGFLKQHSNYGFHRGAFFAHGDKNSKRISYFIPTLFVFYLIILLIFFIFTFFFNTRYNILNTIYFPAIIYLIFSAQLFFNALFDSRNIIVAFLSPLVLFLTHLTYGILFVKGLLKGLRNKENIYI
ncbi:hypothetical protein A2954_02875 [Candidatus Roizmanbacteria bacterium RIFCSPLOWO2_01_FULL_37_12]|uniref:Glycosyltransferase 2-like domain-containing protein n=1 Tax=Candidatus Roizmanbacteria bacterium RIFCSPLOWO2_01_FULL_37_12 TaxID=1802056 RepID=A0A1F7IAC1_9BACT|nr:MAG: hypothetical protein A3D76_04945 [Candidatus Roizmanbacteria bacterium RIFCSPHIGHO2_02_FULL_37_9b]OGK40320.1 MAG: hypothetical protein A2954_02875 [Candidatus Roizmanbacteria bacterium RIFCSPLOWO2_01_FULL_37_12]